MGEGGGGGVPSKPKGPANTLLIAAREARGLKAAQCARALERHAHADPQGRWRSFTCSEEKYRSWEQGRVPREQDWPVLTSFFQLTPEQLGFISPSGLVPTASSHVAMPIGDYADDLCAPSRSAGRLRLDDSYVASLRSRTSELISLDIQFGGDQSSRVALDLFRSICRKLGGRQVDGRIERDLYAAAGELAEVTGWLLYDAGRHDLVRRVNLEALHLCRLAGDRSMEFLVLQNMAMHAGDLGRPRESLRIARMMLDTAKLSPRLETLFRIREARALAQAGDGAAARRGMRVARSLYLDGTREHDPAWAWWINDQEFAWHQATVEADLGDWHAAIDAFHTSLVATPPQEVRRRYNHLAALLNAQIQATAWHDASQTIECVMPFVDEVASTRTVRTLLAGLDGLDAARPSADLREAARELKSLLISTRHSG